MIGLNVPKGVHGRIHSLEHIHNLTPHVVHQLLDCRVTDDGVRQSPLLAGVVK